MAINAKKILVPVKGDQAGEEAFRLACELSRDTKARLYALYVIEVQQELPIDIDADTTQGEAILSRIEALSREEKYPVDATYIQARHAGPAIVQEVMERGIELIVLGVPYKQRFGHFTIGATTLFVLKNAPCPVILRREQIGVASRSGLTPVR